MSCPEFNFDIEHDLTQ